eukprot:13544746-Ditylum_brightwellii.AAC.1
MDGDENKLQAFEGNFAAKHNAPPGLRVIPTHNASRTNKIWSKMETYSVRPSWPMDGFNS